MKIKNIFKSYSKVNVVEDVSFEIPKGMVTSLIGPNGAGKSTIMNIISRLIRSDQGSVQIDELDILKWNSNSLSKKISILSQSYNMNVKLTVEELVTFGRYPYCKGHLGQDDYEKVNEAIHYMSLETIRDKYIDELSGGQRQRAFIAMVIAQDTDYILLDEPINNLDIYHATSLMKLVRRLCDELGKTIILVMHDINYASFYSDYIGAFKDGRLIAFGKSNDVINEELLKNLYNIDVKIEKINEKKLSIYY